MSDSDAGSDHAPQLEQVEYVHSDKSVSATEILEEGIEDGRAPIRLRILEKGVVRRTAGARVLRGSLRTLRGGEDEAAKRVACGSGIKFDDAPNEARTQATSRDGRDRSVAAAAEEIARHSRQAHGGDGQDDDVFSCGRATVYEWGRL